MLKVFSLILSLIAFLAVIWIIVPAPAYYVWFWAVAASEWSLWFGAFALSAAGLSVIALMRGGTGKITLAALVISIAAFAISLYPLLSVLALAREQKTALSLTEYFKGLQSENLSGKEQFTTRTFANPNGQELQFDFYAPLAVNENNGAAVVVIHGGSWSGGVRNDFPQWNRWLAATGFAVFDIDYRLAPQPNYLSATGDVKCAVRFIKTHAAEFGIAPDRIALFGRSAGAHLALLAAYSANDSRLPPSCPGVEENEQVRAVVSFYAPVDMPWAYDHPANPLVINGPQTIGDFIGGDPHASAELLERFQLATPLTHINDQTPPTFLVHGGRDQLVRPENLLLLDTALNAHKIAHKTIFIPYAQHGFDFDFYGFGSQIIKPAMLDFLRENTKAK
jgi:acetyl esterase/lipase